MSEFKFVPDLLFAREQGVELSEKHVGCVWSAVDHWLVLGLGQNHILLLEVTIQMLPIVELLVKFEAVVKLVHLDFFGVVAA